MAGALILTILPVILILTVLFLVSGQLDPVAAVGLAALLGLVAVVFVGVLRAARRQQPSRAHGGPNRSEDHSEEEEEALGEARDVRRMEDAIGRWDDEGGSARP
jgi:hypothetical protein